MVWRQPNILEEYTTSILWVEEYAKQETGRAANFMLSLLLKPKDDSNIFLQNVGLSPNHMALKPRRL
jgi:hypothetical protein